MEPRSSTEVGCTDVRFAVLACAFALACGGPSDATEGSPDSGMGASAIAAPRAPAFGCRPGYRTAVLEVGSVCDPWPENGRGVCGARTEAHFPGRLGCEPLGACPPAGEPWATDLPKDEPVFYVAPGEGRGLGTRESPYHTIRDALIRAGSGSTIAIAEGTYRERLEVERAVTLRGACSARTHVVARDPDEAILLPGYEVVVRGLHVSNESGPGIDSTPGTPLTLEDVAITDVRGMGLYASDAPIRMRDVLVRGVSPSAEETGLGVWIADAETTIERLAIEDVHDLAIMIAGGHATLDHVVVSGVAESPDGFARGLALQRQARVEARGIVIEHAPDIGVAVFDGSSLTLEDAVVRDIDGLAAGASGRGVLAQDFGTLEARRVLVERTRDVALVAWAGHATYEDVYVRDTAPRTSRQRGTALFAGFDTDVALDRIVMVRNALAAIVVHGLGANVVAHDLDVRDTVPALDGRFGRAVTVQAGATFTGERVRLASNHESALIAALEGTYARVSDLEIVDTDRQACEACEPYGVGATAVNQATLDLTRFHIGRSWLCGIFLDNLAAVHLAQGVVEDNPVGACIADPEIDARMLQTDVRWQNNGTNLQAVSLPVPSNVAVLDE